jgi:hypothetical protein
VSKEHNIVKEVLSCLRKINNKKTGGQAVKSLISFQYQDNNQFSNPKT